ncbi:MAG: hypothetical protein JWN48_5840, partial [Myxococcaceae bacterium]|nr:hypothetical protein [Myxococcaceae bacterium]
MQPDKALVGTLFAAALAALATGACSKKEEPKPTPAVEAPKAEKLEAAKEPTPRTTGRAPRRALALALSQFAGAKPKPARMELIAQHDGVWKTTGFEDPESNVFHKGIALMWPGETPRLVTLGGMKAAIKGWGSSGEGYPQTTYWTEAFGGKFDRMRDAELGDVDGDGKVDIAVGTHDQGVVAYLKRVEAGKWEVVQLDRQPNTFIHEIELGDLNQDGATEIYATPSEPNKLDAGEQSGYVVSYVPKLKQGRKIVADLGKRHAKEILVKDVDGDGKDELYVAVEALTKGDRNNVEIVEPVEIRRYDADTAPTKGKVVARIQDRYCRFLTAGDVDGDGKKELVAAAFRTGVWLLKPGADPKQEWSIENIDANSSGFEHAALLTDLDEDGKDELYVAADDQGELHRYVWRDGKPERETILKRDNPRET